MCINQVPNVGVYMCPFKALGGVNYGLQVFRCMMQTSKFTFAFSKGFRDGALQSQLSSYSWVGRKLHLRIHFKSGTS